MRCADKTDEKWFYGDFVPPQDTLCSILFSKLSDDCGTQESHKCYSLGRQGKQQQN